MKKAAAVHLKYYYLNKNKGNKITILKNQGALLKIYIIRLFLKWSRNRRRAHRWHSHPG